ncbi:hypothetical protein GCM10027162_08210 [Streptomyces incanus]
MDPYQKLRADRENDGDLPPPHTRYQDIHVAIPLTPIRCRPTTHSHPNAFPKIRQASGGEVPRNEGRVMSEPRPRAEGTGNAR